MNKQLTPHEPLRCHVRSPKSREVWEMALNPPLKASWSQVSPSALLRSARSSALSDTHRSRSAVVLVNCYHYYYYHDNHYHHDYHV